MSADAAEQALTSPPEERERELRWLHENFNTPDDLAYWPPEMGGGVEPPAPVHADRTPRLSDK